MAKKLVDGVTFEDALKRFTRSNADAMKYARLCSELALANFAEHGNTTLLQRFHDALVKNWNRRVAFVRWAVEHSSALTYKGSEFLKVENEDFRNTDLPGAREEPFWEFAPDKEQVFFGENEIVASLENALKRFGGKRYSPKDDAAAAKLAAARSIVSRLNNPTNVPDIVPHVEAERVAA